MKHRHQNIRSEIQTRLLALVGNKPKSLWTAEKYDLTRYYSNIPVTEYQSDFQKARTVTVIKHQSFHSSDICEDKSYYQLDTPIKIENFPV